MDNPSAEEFWKALRKELKITASMPFLSLCGKCMECARASVEHVAPHNPPPPPMEFCREHGKTALFHSCLMFSGFILQNCPSLTLLLLPQMICWKYGEGLEPSMLSNPTVTVGSVLSDELQGEPLEWQSGPVTGWEKLSENPNRTWCLLGELQLILQCSGRHPCGCALF